MNTFNRKAVHDELVNAGVAVYTAKETYQTACDIAMSCIDEAREVLTPVEFAAWGISEFGSGGSIGADDYVEGSIPHALRAKGMMPLRALRKGDSTDKSAAAVNTWTSAIRSILRKMASDATFTWGESFNRTKCAAQGKRKGSNRTGTGKKEAEGPGEVIDLKAYKAFADAHFITALEICEQLLVKRKDTIRAATLRAIREQLVANSK